MAQENGGVERGAPARLCRCHGEPMDRHRGSYGGWTCAVKRRARQLAAHHAAPEEKNYARTRRLLRARIARKRERIARLEEQLAQEDAGGDGAGPDRQDGPHPHPPQAQPRG